MIVIAPLVEKDIPGAVTAIQQAFAEDPYNLWVYDDRSKAHSPPDPVVSSFPKILTCLWHRKLDLNRNRVSLGIRCKWGIRNALFYVAKDPESGDPDRVLGIAMWMPPRSLGQKETWGEWLEGWKLWVQQVGMNLWYGRGGLNVKRYYIWKKKQAEAQSEIWTDQKGFYFLNIMVVLPGMQGRGIGKALAREVTKIADEKAVRCYLESSRDVPNVKIYETYGFHFVKQMDCDDEGDICKLFCMVREPQKLPLIE